MGEITIWKSIAITMTVTLALSCLVSRLIPPPQKWSIPADDR